MTALKSRPVAKRLGVAGLATVLLTLALAGSATASIPAPSGVIHGCYLPGTSYAPWAPGSQLVNPLFLTQDNNGACPNGSTPIGWNQNGQQGTPGASANVTVATEPAGANCATGGKKISTSVGTGPVTVSYVCNGAVGSPGKDGADGKTNVYTTTLPTTTFASGEGVFSQVVPVAGDYSVIARGVDLSGGSATLGCTLSAGNTVSTLVAIDRGFGLPSILMGTVSGLAAGGIIQLDCSNRAGTTLKLDGKIISTQTTVTVVAPT